MQAHKQISSSNCTRNYFNANFTNCRPFASERRPALKNYKKVSKQILSVFYRLLSFLHIARCLHVHSNLRKSP